MPSLTPTITRSPSPPKDLRRQSDPFVEMLAKSPEHQSPALSSAIPIRSASPHLLGQSAQDSTGDDDLEDDEVSTWFDASGPFVLPGERQRRRSAVSRETSPWNRFTNWIRGKSTGADSGSFTTRFWERGLPTLGYVLGWYSTSLSLSLYNKWLFARDYYNFGLPLFTTFIHMSMQFALAWTAVIWLVPHMRPAKAPKWKDYVTKVLPCGMATGFDVGLSNSSLQTISLSFYTMVKSGAPVFVVLFAFLFKLEKPTFRLLAVICIIVVGVILMVVGEFKFDLVGYIQVQVATVMSGLRWALVQVLLNKESMGMNNPLATTIYLSPLMAISLLFFSLLSENYSPLFVTPPNSRAPALFGSFDGFIHMISIITLGGVLAFVMLIVEYKLISVTSVVTFSICGIVKEILTISVSHFIFGDNYTVTNLAGLVVSLIGLGLYNYIRITAMREKHYSKMGAEAAAFGVQVDEGRHSWTWNRESFDRLDEGQAGEEDVVPLKPFR
ncbi:triose-phosphate transporter family-domain-containing protein [Cladochytrium replicatum]|nr:triose-phosphate transporter family-domain-containing protein [Cladochytrium replicatum]